MSSIGASTQTHRARWVVPVESPPIPGGCVVFRGETLIGVGPPIDSDQAVVDWGDAVIVPGFVNAHSHLEFSGLAAPLGHAGMSFPDWILTVLEYRRAPEFDAAAAVVAGFSESIAAGTTTLGDIASCVPLLPFDRPPEALDLVSFVELIGLAAPRGAGQLERLNDVLARAEPAGVRHGISPHAPYTVRPELFEAAVAASAARGKPLAFHLAESPEELQLLATADGKLVDYMRTLGAWDDTAVPRGTRPLDYLRRLAHAHRALVIHGNYLAADEIEFLAAQRESMATVYCPRTHAYFNHAPHPLPKLLAAGAAVALGTDGRCTNPDLSLLAEMRHVAQAFPQLDPHRILQLGTLDGAQALGVAAETGSLVAGKRADFVVLQLGSPEPDPVAAVLSEPPRIAAVYHRGRRTV